MNALTIEIEYLFLINKIFINIFKTNDKILIINCTYKINRYNISLIILIKTIYFNISFYFDMYFLKNETIKNYEMLFDIIKKNFKNINFFFQTYNLSTIIFKFLKIYILLY